jgi:hypothetical protein
VPTMTETGLDRAYVVLVRRLRLRRSLEAAAIAACVAAFSALAGVTPGDSAVIAAVALLLAFVGLGLLPRYRRISLDAFAEHLDRRFPALEESSRLVLVDEEQLGPLQQLQRARVLEVLPNALTERQQWLPTAARAATLSVLVAAGVLALLAAPIRHAIVSTPIAERVPAEITQDGLIESTEVRIEPPAYTGIDATVTDSLDLELPEGSTVSWQIGFRRAGNFVLMIGDGQRVHLSPGADDIYTAEARVDQTSLYRFVEELSGSEQALAGIHTLSVSLDKPPRVRIVAPGESALEIERDEAPRFDSQVVVRDDFGVGPVEVRASVAKGSGEGVKFRDAVFDFDTQSAYEASDSAGRAYQRAWDLEALGMEPGDEVYFFVVARDNREPEPNVSRSDTVVVRWLDEAPEAVTVGDIAIDVMPEYYKSQRQIIIETEQLIADRDLLDADTFNATSRALGDAQAELKSRYGQFLGDEFDESLDGDFDPVADAESAEPDAETDEQDDDAHHDEGGHEHADLPGANRPGSAEALVARFTHRHEAADIGPVSARNPVGLMKRAVAKMWQSELHLRLSEPADALHYQYEALAYYNRAREADRIFTRRLGFEPPPVSEDRRLTGDISDVRGARLDQTGAGAGSDRHLFRELHERLSRRSPAEPFDPEELGLLARAADRLQELAADRPALIRQAATLEQLRLSGGPAEADCEDCVADAIRAAWSALSSAYARPVLGARPVATDDALIRDYAGLEPHGE